MNRAAMVPLEEHCVCKCHGSECVAPSHIFYLTLSVVLKMFLQPNEAELVLLLDFFLVPMFVAFMCRWRPMVEGGWWSWNDVMEGRGGSDQEEPWGEDVQ